MNKREFTNVKNSDAILPPDRGGAAYYLEDQTQAKLPEPTAHEPHFALSGATASWALSNSDCARSVPSDAWRTLRGVSPSHEDCRADVQRRAAPTGDDRVSPRITLEIVQRGWGRAGLRRTLRGRLMRCRAAPSRMWLSFRRWAVSHERPDRLQRNRARGAAPGTDGLLPQRSAILGAAWAQERGGIRPGKPNAGLFDALGTRRTSMSSGGDMESDQFTSASA